MLFERGQFLPFRMLIAFIMAAMIFVIIAGAIMYFRGLELSISSERYYEGFKFALSASSLDGSEGLIEKKNLIFKEGTYYAGTLAKKFHFDKECIEFQSTLSNIEVLGDGQAVKMKQRLTVNVYYQCIIQPSGSDCEEKCYVSFGKKPQY